MGSIDVFVRTYPDGAGGRWQVSSGGGTEPIRTRDGRELVYVDNARRLTTVKVSTSGSALTFSTPSIVSNTGYVGWHLAQLRHFARRTALSRDEAGRPAIVWLRLALSSCRTD